MSKELVWALRLLSSKQGIVEDTHGNVSHREGPRFYIKPSGMEYDAIGYEDVVEIDIETGKAKGRRKPSVDTEHHRSIYMRNPTVGAICHTHSPYATAWAISGNDMPVFCTEHADYFGHVIRCLPFSSLESWGWISLLQNQHGPEQAVLLGQHGTLTFSRHVNDPIAAVKLAVALEAIAKKYVLASCLGPPPEPLTDYEVNKWHDRYQNRYGQ